MARVRKYARGLQPGCAACSHPLSFHGGGAEEHCRALACKCPTWEEPMITSAEVSEVIGRGETWVKEHAAELGGVKVSGRWRFPLQEILAYAESHPAEKVGTPSKG